MKTEPTSPTPLEEIEKDLEALAPLVRQAFRRVEGPSPETLRAIRAQAEFHLARQRRVRRFTPLFRGLAVAAGLALLLTGAFRLHLTQREGQHAQEVARLLHLGDARPLSGTAESASLAKSLLDVQGLSEEAFLATADEAEPLWL